jgi:hypothetical protein
MTGWTLNGHLIRYIPLGGDVFTYLGGFVLVNEVWGKWREFVRELVLVKVLAGSTFVEDGETIRTAEDLELVHLKASRGKVIIGFILLTVGFIFTVSARLLEIFGP